MDRKQFLKKGFMAAAAAAVSSAVAALPGKSGDEKAEKIGFNHIPNTNSTIMDNVILHKANTRGHANHGWLDSHHTFSFANYYNPERMHFGALRVLNDDRVAAGMGFGTHPHDNMEIISIPLAGDLEHKDSMGNVTVIKEGDIQVMSAGTGIRHSEYNKNADRETRFLQIWLFPRERNVTPRYDQLSLNTAESHNQLQQILSPNPDDAGVWIHQDAWFHLGTFDKDRGQTYQIQREGNGLYIFVLEGSFDINGITLERRDGLGITHHGDIQLRALSSNARVLLMDVPMNIG